MSPQETQVLEIFLNELMQARVGSKDPQAEAMIANAVVRQPDAAYLLVQRALLLDQALTAAKSQIAALQNQLQGARAGSAGSSFLDAASAWGNSAVPRAVVPPAAVPAAAPQQMPDAAPQVARPGFLSGGLGGSLGSIAATAAGVAGGAFLFQGIGNLLHHNSGSGLLARPAESAPSDTVINNYYGSEEPPREQRDNGSLDDGWDNIDYTDDGSSII